MKPKSQVFTEAADYIEKYGLHKGDYYQHDGPDHGTTIEAVRVFANGGAPMCIVGAIVGAAGDRQWAPIGELQKFWRHEYPELYEDRAAGCLSISVWNDKYGTQENVVALLRKAANESSE